MKKSKSQKARKKRRRKEKREQAVKLRIANAVKNGSIHSWTSEFCKENPTLEDYLQN